MKETLDRRALCAIQWRDAATLSKIDAPLTIRFPGAKWVRSLSGLTVLMSAPGLESYASMFDLSEPSSPKTPSPNSVTVQGEVSDPSGCYLPRRFDITLPRNVERSKSDEADSVFDPVSIDLLPGPCIRVPPGWTQLRVTTFQKQTGERMPHVLVRVRAKVGMPANEKVVARGMSDLRGEAVVILPCVTNMTDVRLEFIPPKPPFHAVVDWKSQDATVALASNQTPPKGKLLPGGTHPFTFDVTTEPDPQPDP
jgi:hypothetical protein